MPVTTYESCPEMVLLGREICGDQGKDLHWDAVYVNEGVPLLPDSLQRSQGIPVKLANFIQG